MAGPYKHIIWDWNGTLINDAWLLSESIPGETFEERRAAFYSQATTGASAGYKVAEDALVDGLLDFLNEYDFGTYAVSGAPGGGASQSIELIRGSSVSHIYGQKGMPIAQRQAFVDSVRGFVDIYNALPQYQAVKGGVEFSSPIPGR